LDKDRVVVKAQDAAAAADSQARAEVWVEAVEPGKDPAANAFAPSAGRASLILEERLASSIPVRSAVPRWLVRESFFVREQKTINQKKEKTCQVEIELDPLDRVR
jgi:hypothetical protein